MLDFWNHTTEISMPGMVMVLVICAVSAYVLYAMLGEIWLSLIAFPGFVMASLATRSALDVWSLSLTGDPTFDIIMDAGLGVIAAFVPLAVGYRIASSMD